MSNKLEWALVFWTESCTTTILEKKKIEKYVKNLKQAVADGIQLLLPWTEGKGAKAAYYSAKILQISNDKKYLESIKVDEKGRINTKAIPQAIMEESKSIKDAKKQKVAKTKSNINKRNSFIMDLPPICSQISTSANHLDADLNDTAFEDQDSLKQRNPKGKNRKVFDGANLHQQAKNALNETENKKTKKNSRLPSPFVPPLNLHDNSGNKQNVSGEILNVSNKNEEQLNQNQCENCRSCICKDLRSLVTPEYVALFDIQAKLLQNLINIAAPGSTLVNKKMEIYPNTGVKLSFGELNKIIIESRGSVRGFIRLMFLSIINDPDLSTISEEEVRKFNGAEELNCVHPYIRDAILGYIRNRYNVEVNLSKFNDVVSRKIYELKQKKKLSLKQLEEKRKDARIRAQNSRKRKLGKAAEQNKTNFEGDSSNKMENNSADEESDTDGYMEIAEQHPELETEESDKKKTNRKKKQNSEKVSNQDEPDVSKQNHSKRSRIIQTHSDLDEDANEISGSDGSDLNYSSDLEIKTKNVKHQEDSREPDSRFSNTELKIIKSNDKNNQTIKNASLNPDPLNESNSEKLQANNLQEKNTPSSIINDQPTFNHSWNNSCGQSVNHYNQYPPIPQNNAQWVQQCNPSQSPFFNWNNFNYPANYYPYNNHNYPYNNYNDNNNHNNNINNNDYNAGINNDNFNPNFFPQSSTVYQSSQNNNMNGGDSHSDHTTLQEL